MPRVAKTNDVDVEHVVVDLPHDLDALPGDALRFEGLDTSHPKMRTADGTKYVGRYVRSIGTTLVVANDQERRNEATIIATSERRLKFTKA